MESNTMEPITLGIAVASLAGGAFCAFCACNVLGSLEESLSLPQRVKFAVATAILLGIGMGSMEKNTACVTAPNQTPTHISVSYAAPDRPDLLVQEK